MSELYHYAGLFLSQWWSLVSAGAFFGFDEVAKRYWPWLKRRFDRIPESTRRNFEVAAIVLAVFYSGYVAWQEEHEKFATSEANFATAKSRADGLEHQINDRDGYRDQINRLREQLDVANSELQAKPKEVIRYIASSPAAPSVKETRDPDAFYQLGSVVAKVEGASPDLPQGKIIFQKIQPNEKLDPSKIVEYRNYNLRCLDNGRKLPSAELPPGIIAGTVIVPPALGWSCDIAGTR